VARPLDPRLDRRRLAAEPTWLELPLPRPECGAGRNALVVTYEVYLYPGGTRVYPGGSTNPAGATKTLLQGATVTWTFSDSVKASGSTPTTSTTRAQGRASVSIAAQQGTEPGFVEATVTFQGQTGATHSSAFFESDPSATSVP